MILTSALITTIFYFHPSTSSAVSVFRTVTILPETNGRVAETYVEINQRVTAGQPLFRLDATEQDAAIETASAGSPRSRPTMVVAQLAARRGRGQHRPGPRPLQQADDEYQTRAELMRRNASAISQREVDRALVAVETAQGAVDAAIAGKARSSRRSTSRCPPRRRAPRPRSPRPRWTLDKTLVVAGTDGIVQQFALRPGDVVNPMLRPAGILVPDRRVTGLVAGFGQIEAQVIKVGMLGEVACMAMPFTVIPVVVTDVQDVIAAGQIRPTDQLADVQTFAAARHDHRHHGAALRGRARPPAAGQRPASPTPTPRTTTRCRTPRSGRSTPSCCTRSTPPASSTP